ncbi:MAG: hypothetical protein ACLSS9_03180 [Acutalibacteraceae bacterium]
MAMKERQHGQRAFWVLAVVYSVICIAAGVFALKTGSITRAAGGFVAPAILLLFPIFRKLCRMQPVYALQSMLIGFIALAFPLGVVMSLYSYISWYDIAVHALSGAVTAVIGMCAYIWLLPDGRVWKAQPAASLFAAFGFVQLVAAVWELLEYAGFLLTGHDSQWVAQTGVGDTMEDMFAAFVGGAVIVALLWRHTRKPLRMFAPLDEFCRLNTRAKSRDRAE